MAFTALFDACVLYPAPLRDLLMELACTGLFRAVWTERIHEEWIRSLIVNRPDLDPERLRRTAQTMNEAVEDCLIDGYQSLVPAIHLPDEEDRHVLAAAIVADADVLVTANLRDFPPALLDPFRIEAQHPDTFITHVLNLDGQAIGAVARCRSRLRKPPVSVDGYLDMLLRQELVETVSFLRRWASVI